MLAESRGGNMRRRHLREKIPRAAGAPNLAIFIERDQIVGRHWAADRTARAGTIHDLHQSAFRWRCDKDRSNPVGIAGTANTPEGDEGGERTVFHSEPPQRIQKAAKAAARTSEKTMRGSEKDSRPESRPEFPSGHRPESRPEFARSSPVLTGPKTIKPSAQSDHPDVKTVRVNACFVNGLGGERGWRRGSESNRRIKVLQTSALPEKYRDSDNMKRREARSGSSGPLQGLPVGAGRTIPPHRIQVRVASPEAFVTATPPHSQRGHELDGVTGHPRSRVPGCTNYERTRHFRASFFGCKLL